MTKQYQIVLDQGQSFDSIVLEHVLQATTCTAPSGPPIADDHEGPSVPADPEERHDKKFVGYRCHNCTNAFWFVVVGWPRPAYVNCIYCGHERAAEACGRSLCAFPELTDPVVRETDYGTYLEKFTEYLKPMPAKQCRDRCQHHVPCCRQK